MARNHICPVEKAGSLDSKIRRWAQNPKKLLKPYVQDGMTVLDLGCGPGFFTMDMARLVGEGGRVIAADLQTGMLERVKTKIQGTDLEDRIILHQCEKSSINVTEQVDFILAFYMIHELSDQNAFFREMASILKPGGRMLIVEPPFHVSKKAFDQMIKNGQDSGLVDERGPKVLLGKTVIMKK